MANNAKPLGVNSIWAITGTKTDPGASKAATGWVVELPPYQTQNWIDWKQDSFIAHVNQHGVPVWDAVTEYQGNLSYTKGSDGNVYKALLTNTNIDPVNPLNSTYWKKAFEDFGSVQVVSDALAAHLLDYQMLANIGNVPVARVNLSVWSRAESDARYAMKAGDSTIAFNVAEATQPEHAVRLGQVAGLLTQATETTLGVTRIATNAQVAAGTSDTTTITPLKLATLFLSKAGNLAGLGNVATARTNLGLGSIATESADGFLRTTNNLSDVPNKGTARTNLGLGAVATFNANQVLQPGNNLGDLASVSAARANLGLADSAVLGSGTWLRTANNLADLPNVAVARQNLGLADSAVLGSGTWLRTGNNLADLPDKQAARNNLQLGGAAVKNVINVPGDLDFTSAVTGAQNWYRLPNGIIVQFGRASITSNTRINFSIPMNVGSIQLTIAEAQAPINLRSRTCGVGDFDINGFYASGSTATGIAQLAVHWHATGWA